MDSTQYPTPDSPSPRMRWITDDLLEKTCAVWSEYSGQEVTKEDGVEILMNVQRLMEIMIKDSEIRTEERQIA